MILSSALGCSKFQADHNVRLSYVTGAMYKGIASIPLVLAMAKSGLLSFFGSGGLDLADIELALQQIRAQVATDLPYGMNLLHSPDHPELELETVKLFLRYGVKCVEAAAYMNLTPAVVLFRLKGIAALGPARANKIIAKVSHPEVASKFMQPPPEALLRELVQGHLLTAEEATLGGKLPVATDICVEADSGGHTDQGVALALFPAMLALRDHHMQRFGYERSIRMGAAGGIGTPAAAAAVFIMGADFITTGSINQCTVEAGTSDAVKDLLQDAGIRDTTYAPSGDMFEIGARIQVLKKGLFFPARAAKLFELYTRYNSLDQIDAAMLDQLEQRYFGRSLDLVWQETSAYYASRHPPTLTEAEQHPKRKMALIFKWYFVHSSRLALQGAVAEKVNFQIHCGPSLGAFNAWVKGTELEPWRTRHVVHIGEAIMRGAADLISKRMRTLTETTAASQVKI
jgi:trans-AT polyketide synthase/acyltransferase/oxidoreductase domain-containing protein